MLMCLVLVLSGSMPVYAETSVRQDTEITTAIEQLVNKTMESEKIPGAAVVVVKEGKTIYKQSFGFSDTQKQERVTADTLFEIGSNSKAFTSLAVHQLVEQKRLSLDDPVQSYIPWFRVTYKGQQQPILIKHLLYHTSGIPFESIGSIPISSSENAIEETVRAINHTELVRQPGTEYEYATINYDILGYVVEKVTGQSYEQYVQQQVIAKLGLTHTFLKAQAPVAEMARGHKIELFSPRVYDAPEYRGNTPAGYVVSNLNDMERWLQIQLGLEASAFRPELVRASHLPDRSVAPAGDGFSYASGWMIYQDGGGQISHGGNNPAFSSYMVFRPEEKLGAVVLTNINSLNASVIAEGAVNLVLGKEAPLVVSDTNLQADRMASISLVILGILLLVLGGAIVQIFVQVYRGERKLAANAGRICLASFVAFVVMGSVLTAALYYLPDVFFMGLPWSFIEVWLPITIFYAMYALVAGLVLFNVYITLTRLFPKSQETSMTSIVIQGLISGFGNALIIFMINLALTSTNKFHASIFLYFLLGILLYIVGEKMMRSRLIVITNEIVYEKRMELIRKIFRTPYQKYETLDNGEIYAGLNNDTETISTFANSVVVALTSAVTLVFCFIYLGSLDLYGFLFCLAVIFVAVGLYTLAGRFANKVWEETRDIQNVFFSYITDMIGGFKELYLTQAQRKEFEEDMERSCSDYRHKKSAGQFKFVNVYLIGELLFVVVIGTVAFLFPVLFPSLQKEMLISYVFVFLYMTGPVHGILNAVPELIRIKISWQRLNALLDSLSVETRREEESLAERNTQDFETFSTEQVRFRYKNKEGEEFSVGPLDFSCRKGEIVFIVGGNGSGKSTFAKLITGLYEQDEGEFFMNGQKVNADQRCEFFSAIFSDFYLFEKMYGIDYQAKQEEVSKHLEVLRIADKVEVDETGTFSTTKLSTGQRKRLALMLSLVRDQPIFLFDEWAADQDPEYRQFFYESLLPEMKRQGKCVIAITHDDRYFHLADQVVKMESGRIISEQTLAHA
ncbi:cyclic peptide edeine export ABC transporter EdeA [Brevibacillus sp. AG]|uniref:cyclic peptide edeine export ABC transporter EdeA n=1 Tax=Brevibacillus sp. AG TaxID=3020891 RepID=UPI00147D5984|nr:cyclic peptide edeine export ABC transporter EdeA [Brevibacillus sp. AG]MDC0759187.1 cyclic peptide edeine export ABC transporter EdeA [Brevibacillus sp. AG]